MTNQPQSLSQLNSYSEVSSQTLAWKIAAAADERKAEDIILLDVGELSYLTDYFVIVTGFSKAQVRAISDSIEAIIAKQLLRSPLRTSGKNEASWIIHDYGDVIAHMFLPQEREFYNLEAFWGHARRFEYQPELQQFPD
ncbi:ribosome silencing factor [Gloeocapsa sp. PCC 73106]|uniref:ribosome silencing factor n=1 Tax=Gloeocapsa sp. PCC 73106 TaxID=102232 RepID=UPI0002ACA9B6|nr:ribosome silencing factor [Gloeocapsa sp. PCC 73106]ELR96474.1 iojap-like ribosome-associated protein [Gloeocapsa sp. PCC 73106]